MKKAARWASGLAVVAVGVAAIFYVSGDHNGASAQYRLQPVDTGAISLVVSSSGNINPVTTVTIGSQVSGKISALLADFNSPVKEGQVIARIDPAPFEAKVQEQRAQLANARANVSIQKAMLIEYRADVAGAQAAFDEAERDLSRKRALLDRRVVASSAVDTAVAVHAQAKSTLDSLRAKLSRQQAQIESAEAQVLQNQATLRQRELDLQNTIITSPVDGVVINRSVDIGQTVAASLQSPELFTIAQDLSQMQVETSVDEADIGRIREGQQVSFTVDAYPERSFEGTVKQIRKSPLEVSNVITYTVVVSADNGDLALLPGMTANVEIVVGRRENVLRVPNAALRFAPPGAPPPPTAGTANGPRNADLSPEERRAAAQKRMADRIEALDAKLGLTDAQKAQIAEIYRENGRAFVTLRQSGMGEEQMKAAQQKMRMESGRRIEAILDENQRPKYRVIVAEASAAPPRPGRVWTIAPGGVATPVELTIGISDGSTTEVRRGGLKVGDRVIVGYASPGGGA